MLQLSLRENPLVVRFVQEISLHPPSLLELSARVIRAANVPFDSSELPKSMNDYLNTAHCCVNPKCKGYTHQKGINFEHKFYSIFLSFQVSSSIVALNISSLLIFVESIVYHYCNICAHQSKFQLFFFKTFALAWECVSIVY